MKKSISKERTFAIDTIDVKRIKSLIVDMVEKLAYELRSSGKLTSVITIKSRYTDFNIYTKQKRLPYTASDGLLIQWGEDLFKMLYTRRQLIRLVGVRFSGLVSSHYWINLFEDTMKDISLQQEMDIILIRFRFSSAKQNEQKTRGHILYKIDVSLSKQNFKHSLNYVLKFIEEKGTFIN